MDTKNDRYVWDNWFSIELPGGWSVSEDAGVICVFDAESGVGAMNISLAHRRKLEGVSPQEAIDLAIEHISQQRARVSDIKMTPIDSCPASFFSYAEGSDSGSTYWEVWHIVGKDRIAFITYNCSAADAAAELLTRRQIISSFRWEAVQPMN